MGFIAFKLFLFLILPNIAVLIRMYPKLSDTLTSETEPNLNKYLFDEHNFQFIDLTKSVSKIQSTRQTELDYVASFETDRIRTSIVLGSKPEPSRIYSNKTIELEKLILPLIIADLTSKVGGDSNFLLQKHHLDFFINNYFGKTEQPCLLIFKFGRSSKWDANHTDTPGISVDIANWITSAYKNIVGVGVDLPSVDPGSSSDYPAHNALVKAGVYVVVNVNLEYYLPDAWCTAVLLPQGEPGIISPVRFVAICPKHRMTQRQVIPWHRL